MNDEPMITLTTPRCIVCGKTDTVRLTRREFANLNSDMLIQHALPDRDVNFCELVATGTHPECWEWMMRESE